MCCHSIETANSTFQIVFNHDYTPIVKEETEKVLKQLERMSEREFYQRENYF
jgi:hypothetical protein